jgi:hypothetical protein
MLASWLVSACVREPAGRAAPPNPDPTTPAPPTPPPELPCDGRDGSGEDCLVALADADLVVPGLPTTVVPDLTGDGRADVWITDLQSGGSYHSTWRRWSLRIWPDPAGDPIVVSSRAAVTVLYDGTDEGVRGVVPTVDATGDGVRDAWFVLATGEQVLVPGPLGREPGDPDRRAVGRVDRLALTGDIDRDGAGEVLIGAYQRCEGPFSGTVDGCGPEGSVEALPLEHRQLDVDLDGDGVDDLLAVELRPYPGPDSHLWVTVRALDGSALPPVIAELGLEADYEDGVPQTAAADFDGDGVGDLAWVEPTRRPDRAWIRRGPLSGRLPIDGPADLELTGTSFVVRGAVDVEGDGASELLLTDADPLGGLFVVHGTATGTTEPVDVAYTIGKHEPLDGYGAGDLDGDGRGDVVISAEGLTYVFFGASLAAR